ncbi:TAP42-like protein [Obelidium mucronatum]|nr:TAP42-like protein [Obelidium mucronatum]
MDSNSSLSSQFEKAQRVFNEIEESDLGCSCDEYQTKLHGCIALLSTCAVMVRQLGIFSSNETIKDLNTLDLRFLLIDFYLGVLALKRTAITPPTPSSSQESTALTTTLSSSSSNTQSSTRSPSSRYNERLAIVKDGMSFFDTFLFSLEMHEALGEDDKKYVLDPKAAFTMPKDPALLRGEKIQRFKRERALKEKLRVLQAAVDEARKDSGEKKSSSGNNKIGSGEVDDFDPELRDDDLYRELMMTTIELCVQRSVDEMRSAKDEIDMLEQIAVMEAARAPQQHSSGSKGSDMDARLDDLSQLRIKPDTLLTKEGKPRQPFMITNTSKREEFQKGVFRPGHNLPTMTVDEFLENEFARGNVITGGGKMPEKVVKEDLGEEADDLETFKARAWDDYKDANPKGWGNRMNKG